MPRIVVTGGTGWIGQALVRALVARGDQAVVLSRSAARARTAFANVAGVEIVEGDPTVPGPWQAALAGATAVVNLAGESIGGKRWDARRKQVLHDSRVDATRFVVEAIAALPADRRPRALINASGADYYPFSVDIGSALAVDEDDEVIETSPPGDSFLARLCRHWEAEAVPARRLGVRVALMRTGLVLGHGGALERMVGPFRFFVGGRLGSGRQWVSWIHLDDVVAAYLFALDRDDVDGPLNLVAPQPVRASELARALGRTLGRPSWLPVPGFAVRAAAGELSEYLLNGRRVMPAALLARGFHFAYPTLDGALAEALRPTG
jgi:uncharacterized protein (TIGR01777 family)